MTARLRFAEQEGLATVWMLGLATITMLLVALVTDGARVLAAVSDSGDTAHAAARAGVLGIDPATRTMDPEMAGQEARAVVASQQMTPASVVISGDGTQITVTVQTTIELPLLALLGIRSRTVSSTATADVLQGVTGP